MVDKSDANLVHKVKEITDGLEGLMGKIEDAISLVNDSSWKEQYPFRYTDEELFDNIELMENWSGKVADKIDDLISGFYNKLD